MKNSLTRIKHSLAAIAVLSLVLAGCSSEPEIAQDEPLGALEAEEPLEAPATEGSSPLSDSETAAASAPDAAEISASGPLIGVNAEDQTFNLLMDDGAEQRFQYSETTVVTGADGLQGLSAQEGSEATVWYDSATTPPTALSIEIDTP